MSANLENQQWPQVWKRSVFILIPKKGNAKKYSNYRIIALISHASKVMLKVLQARLQQYMNREHQEAFDCVDHNKNCGKFLKRWEYQTTSPASWEICMQVRKKQFELDMEQQTGST